MPPPPAAAGSSSGVAAEAGGGEGGGEGGGASDGGGEGGVDNGGEEANGDGGLVDDEWKRVPGGPFVARLMCKSRQPVARASYRNFNVAVPFDPIEGPLEPGGEIKFPIVAGAPAEGIVCKLPSSWGADKEVLHFKLKLDKAGATEPTVTIASAFHRPPPDDVEEQEQQLAGAIDLTAGEPALNAEAAEAADEAEAEAEAEGAEEENGEAVAAAEAEADVAAAGSGNDEDDGLPDWVIEQTERRVASKPAAAASSVSVQPQSPEVQPEVEAEEEAEEEAGDEDTAPTLTDEEIAARLEGLHCVWHDDNQEQLDGTTETDLNGVVELLKAIGAEACVLVVPGTTYEIQRSICGARHFTVSSEPNEVEPEVDNGQGERSPPPPPPPPPPVVPRSSARQPKRKERFGDNGELDGAASSFHSAPAARKASIAPDVEMGVPAYALPGEQVWATGLHAGNRKRFKAEVVGLRKQFPRIVVKYIADEGGNTAAIALPEMRTAYLMMVDVEPKDW